MRPLISYAVPVFNGEEFLGQTIKSILAQDYRPLEVIVVDDSSEDRSDEVAARFVPDVRLVQQSNAGPAVAHNRGIQEARSDFLAFQDQDDLWHCEKLSRQMARFRARPQLSVFWTHAQLFWSDDLAHERQCYARLPRTGPIPGYNTTSTLARREVFERVGLLDDSLWFADATECTGRETVASSWR